MPDPVTSWKLKFIQFTFTPTFVLPLPASDLRDVMREWDAFVDGLNEHAPLGVSGAFQTVPTTWAFTHTQSALILNAMVRK